MTRAGFRQMVRAAVCAWAVCGCLIGATAEAGSILLGADYTGSRSNGQRPPQTFLDVGRGKVLTFDVISMTVLRREDALLPFGGFDSVPIAFADLELRHRGHGSDLSLRLDSKKDSVGTMNIFHWPFDNPSVAGSYDASIELFFMLTGKFERRPVSQQGTANFVSDGFWSHEPPPFTPLLVGPRGDQFANWHEPKPPGFGDFFIVEPPVWERTDGIGQMSAPVLIPEPSSIMLLASGLAGVLLARRRSRRR